jgi:D-psicose/D-tagatose/L-ribulose 3-epimerase
MRISVSNLAWESQHDDAVASILAANAIDAIDVVPSRYFENPARPRSGAIERVRTWWADRGIEVVGMQALLFGTSGLNLFGDESSQEAMLDHLAAVSLLAAELGATRLAFGSPKSRDAGGWEPERALQHAVGFFRRAGDAAAAHGVILCLEPNPERYGCNFMTSTDEGAAVVRAVDHPAIRLQLDTGTLTANCEPIDAVLAAHSSLVGHVHASEPDLVVLGEGAADHAHFGPVLAAALPAHVVTIEMLTPRERTPEAAVDAALRVVQRYYAPRSPGQPP